VSFPTLSSSSSKHIHSITYAKNRFVDYFASSVASKLSATIRRSKQKLLPCIQCFIIHVVKILLNFFLGSRKGSLGVTALHQRATMKQAQTTMRRCNNLAAQLRCSYISLSLHCQNGTTEIFRRRRALMERNIDRCGSLS